jgi:hypothetical protein
MHSILALGQYPAPVHPLLVPLQPPAPAPLVELKACEGDRCISVTAPASNAAAMFFGFVGGCVVGGVAMYGTVKAVEALSKGKPSRRQPKRIGAKPRRLNAKRRPR